MVASSDSATYCLQEVHCNSTNFTLSILNYLVTFPSFHTQFWGINETIIQRFVIANQEITGKCNPAKFLLELERTF